MKLQKYKGVNMKDKKEKDKKINMNLLNKQLKEFLILPKFVKQKYHLIGQQF